MNRRIAPALDQVSAAGTTVAGLGRVARTGAPTGDPAVVEGAWYRLGDTWLAVTSDHAPLLGELEDLYGDCAVPGPPPGHPVIRCVAQLLPGPILSLTFEGSGLPDPLEAVRTQFRMLRHMQEYVETPSPVAGWRQLVNTAAGEQLLLASDGRTALISLEAAPPQFAVECIVAVAQGSQPGVLFLHAASVGVARVGALLIGPGRAGKSTTALTLAWRGQTFLGDDLAAVRVATREVIPFPRSAGLREGPLRRALAERLTGCRPVEATGRDGIPRVLVRVSELFPWATAGAPLPLRFAFVLDRFGDRARVSPFRPGLAEIGRLRAVASETVPSWAISPGRDLMRFLSVVNLLSGLSCHLVELGSPEETADLIQTVMERTCT